MQIFNSSTLVTSHRPDPVPIHVGNLNRSVYHYDHSQSHSAIIYTSDSLWLIMVHLQGIMGIRQISKFWLSLWRFSFPQGRLGGKILLIIGKHPSDKGRHTRDIHNVNEMGKWWVDDVPVVCNRMWYKQTEMFMFVCLPCVKSILYRDERDVVQLVESAIHYWFCNICWDGCN